MIRPCDDFKPDVAEVHENSLRPLTVEELQKRLKHIAGLCWGLSIDLSNDRELSEYLKAENERLKEQVKELGGKQPNANNKKTAEQIAAMSPLERIRYEKRRTARLEYSRKKSRARAEAQHSGSK